MSLVGCASVMNESNHAVRVDTKTETGEAIAGADCVALNDYGTVNFKSGQSGSVHRSSKDLEITCTAPGQPPAKGTAVSRANAGMAGNIILGGVIGAVIDHNRGTAYTYPTWVELVFGKVLAFDRRDEAEGKGAVKGTVVGAMPGASVVGQSSSTK